MDTRSRIMAADLFGAVHNGADSARAQRMAELLEFAMWSATVGISATQCRVALKRQRDADLASEEIAKKKIELSSSTSVVKMPTTELVGDIENVSDVGGTPTITDVGVTPKNASAGTVPKNDDVGAIPKSNVIEIVEDGEIDMEVDEDKDNDNGKGKAKDTSI